MSRRVYEQSLLFDVLNHVRMSAARSAAVYGVPLSFARTLPGSETSILHRTAAPGQSVRSSDSDDTRNASCVALLSHHSQGSTCLASHWPRTSPPQTCCGLQTCPKAAEAMTSNVMADIRGCASMASLDSAAAAIFCISLSAACAHTRIHSAL